MAGWERTTRERRTEELPPEFRAAVEHFAEREGVEGALEGVDLACSTWSEPAGRGGLLRRRPRAHDTWALLGGRWLVIVSDASGEPVASVYRRDEIDVREFASPLVEDTGVEITGHVVGGTERATRFLPLDGGAAGKAFRAALSERG